MVIFSAVYPIVNVFAVFSIVNNSIPIVNEITELSIVNNNIPIVNNISIVPYFPFTIPLLHEVFIPFLINYKALSNLILIIEALITVTNPNQAVYII